jgi:hypothetical protein
VPGKGKPGIEDLGELKEGFCFRLRTKNDLIYNICA